MENFMDRSLNRASVSTAGMLEQMGGARAPAAPVVHCQNVVIHQDPNLNVRITKCYICRGEGHFATECAFGKVVETANGQLAVRRCGEYEFQFRKATFQAGTGKPWFKAASTGNAEARIGTMDLGDDVPEEATDRVFYLDARGNVINKLADDGRTLPETPRGIVESELALQRGRMFAWRTKEEERLRRARPQPSTTDDSQGVVSDAGSESVESSQGTGAVIACRWGDFQSAATIHNANAERRAPTFEEQWVAARAESQDRYAAARAQSRAARDEEARQDQARRSVQATPQARNPKHPANPKTTPRAGTLLAEAEALRARANNLSKAARLQQQKEEIEKQITDLTK